MFEVVFACTIAAFVTCISIKTYSSAINLLKEYKTISEAFAYAARFSCGEDSCENEAWIVNIDYVRTGIGKNRLCYTTVFEKKTGRLITSMVTSGAQ